MKALILAAGLGSRLAPITNDRPKSMVPVNGTPILKKQINNLIENNILDITIITGYKSEVIENFVKDFYPTIKIINSIDYKATNNMYSAYLAREYMIDSDFLMMNADVFYDSSVLKSLIDFEYQNAVVTDIGNYLEESMKVIEKDGKLVEISKQISKEEALGASIDVYKFSKEAGEIFFNKCKEYIEEKNELNLWSEIALNDCFKEIDFKACPLNGRWLEIDNLEDLKSAEELFKDE